MRRRRRNDRRPDRRVQRWRRQLGSHHPALSGQSRVCSYARFGTGASDPPTTPQTFATSARDLHTLLNEIGEPGPFVVVGHSYGGAQAVTFAATYPDEVEGLVLLDATPDDVDRGQLRRARRRLRSRGSLRRPLRRPCLPDRQPRAARRGRRLRRSRCHRHPRLLAAQRRDRGRAPIPRSRPGRGNAPRRRVESRPAALDVALIGRPTRHGRRHRPLHPTRPTRCRHRRDPEAPPCSAEQRRRRHRFGGSPAVAACECGSLDVPVDPADPTGATVSLSLARLPATDPDARIGTLITNPGGPGGSGVEFLGNDGLFNDEINRRFDIVSWDPRGVGGTAPLHCGSGFADTFLSTDLAPRDAAGRAALEESLAANVEACTTADASLLAHIGTDAAVADLEAIRQALGGDPITYVGFSYGTLIGLRYAERIPDGLRAMVLDGVVDPERTSAIDSSPPPPRSTAPSPRSSTPADPTAPSTETRCRPTVISPKRSAPSPCSSGDAESRVQRRRDGRHRRHLRRGDARTVLRSHRPRPARRRNALRDVRPRVRRGLRPRTELRRRLRRPPTPHHLGRGRGTGSASRRRRHRAPRTERRLRAGLRPSLPALARAGPDRHSSRSPPPEHHRSSSSATPATR